MPDAWRIDKKKRQDSSFDGAGAALEGGRWNSAGVRVVYASAHLAMAAMEKYVHLTKPVPRSTRFVRFEILFNGIAIKTIPAEELPALWQLSPPGRDTQRIGDEWVASMDTAILAVPSSIVPEETNYLLNPAHPQFKKLTLKQPEEFLFDLRLATLTVPPKDAP